MRARLERALDAYREGGLSPRRRKRIERMVERDSDAARYVRGSEGLSRAIREAWLDGPPSPPPERFFAAIRPELQRIDAERAVRKVRRSIDWFGWLQVRPIPIAAMVAGAAALLVSVNGIWRADPVRLSSMRTVVPLSEDVSLDEPRFEPISLRRFDEQPEAIKAGLESARNPFASQTAIYDVYQGDAGLLIYDGEDDSPLLILALPDEPDDLSDEEPLPAEPQSEDPDDLSMSHAPRSVLS